MVLVPVPVCNVSQDVAILTVSFPISKHNTPTKQKRRATPLPARKTVLVYFTYSSGANVDRQELQAGGAPQTLPRRICKEMQYDKSAKRDAIWQYVVGNND